MIRLLIDKAGLSSTLSSIRNIPNLIRPFKELRIRNYSVTGLQQSSGQSYSPSLAKDVIVYKYENPRFFKIMNFFSVSQFLFWGYLGHWSFTSMKDAPVDEDKEDEEIPWYRKINLGENKYRNTLATLCFVIGKFRSFSSFYNYLLTTSFSLQLMP
jgi:hypothetical protein